MRLALSNMIFPLFQNWMAYTNLTAVNFTLSEGLALRSKTSPPQNNEAFREVKKWTILTMILYSINTYMCIG